MNNGPKELANHYLDQSGIKHAPTLMGVAAGVKVNLPELHTSLMKEASSFSLEGCEKGFAQEMPQDLGHAPKSCEGALSLLNSKINEPPDPDYQAGVKMS